MICLLPWTPVSIVPSLNTTVARFHNTRIMCIIVSLWWRQYGARSLQVGALNLTLRSLESLCHSLHPFLLTKIEDRSLRC
jgi:hypothetical protein